MLIFSVSLNEHIIIYQVEVLVQGEMIRYMIDQKEFITFSFMDVVVICLFSLDCKAVTQLYFAV